jgi:hypothetical protein
MFSEASRRRSSGSSGSMNPTTITTRHQCVPVPIAEANHVPLITAKEILRAPPMCSRCRSRKVWTWATARGSVRYGRQCERCIRWSRSIRKDHTRCVDCRRQITDDSRLSRCSACQKRRLVREHNHRYRDGQYNPHSPFFQTDSSETAPDERVWVKHPNGSWVVIWLKDLEKWKELVKGARS